MKQKKKFLTTTMALLLFSTAMSGCNRDPMLGIGIPGGTPGYGGPGDPGYGLPPGGDMGIPTDPNYGVPGYGDPVYGIPGTDPGYGIPGGMPNGQPNPQLGTFKVDQDLLHQWQAQGITVSGNTLYVAASDSKNITKKGTVIKMDATSGKNWKNIGSSLLGLSYKMEQTISGIASTGSKLLVVDSSQGMFSLNTSGDKIEEIKGTSGGIDIASGGGHVFISTGSTLERSDPSGKARTPIPGVMASGGIGADTRGNLFVVNGSRITMIDMTGRPRDVVMQGLAAPLDVAVDSRNGDIYVLEQAGIKRFTINGQPISQFAHSATQATSIAVDQTGNVYVADYGSDHKDSKIIKFGPATGMANNPGAYMDPMYGGGMNGGAYGMNNGNYMDPMMNQGMNGGVYGAPMNQGMAGNCGGAYGGVY